MASPNPVEEELQRISRLVHDLTEVLRSQREIVRQRGVTLPADAVAGLEALSADLESWAQEVAGSGDELAQLRALADNFALINSTLDLDEVLNAVMDSVIALTGAERGYIVLREASEGEMTFRVARNLDRTTLEASDFIVSRTIVSRVAASGEPLLTTNAQEDDRFSAQESVVGFSLRSILCVPLKARGHTIGVAYADNRIRTGVFGERELRLLVAFADQAAVAIENARLFEQVRRSLAEITALKDLLDNVFTSIASGVITADAEDVILMCNPAAQAILNLPPGGGVGLPLARALPLDEALRARLRAVRTEGRRETLEVEPRIPARGAVKLNLRLSPLLDASRVTQGVAIVMDDLTELRQREAKIAAVKRYLPEAMVDNIESIEALKLGGVRRELTILFTSVCPFERLAQYNPHDYMEILNRYLTIASEAVHQEQGIIDKYMGETVMGLFNTQLNPAPDHAARAVRAALSMARAFASLQRELGGDSGELYYRVGIHSGIATVGNVGSLVRREFTAIGDAVNLGKRLEENAALGQILLSENTYRLCQRYLDSQADAIAVIERGTIQVKGRQQLTRVYEVCSR